MAELAGKERVHALDNLRAIMMWLGVVLHVAINHITTTAPTPWRDSQTSPVADLLFVTIHAFRMPVFFILAGFLAAMLVAKHGYKAMVRNRVRRLALPFAAFWPILFILMALLVLNFRHLMEFGTFGLNRSIMPPPGPTQPVFSTMHMWFVYYLFWFCMAAAGVGMVARRLPQSLCQAVAGAMHRLAGAWWGPALLAVPLAWAGTGYPYGFVAPYGSFIINASEFVHNGAFFAIGWFLFSRRSELLDGYTRFGWYYMAAGLVSAIISLRLLEIGRLAPGSIDRLDSWTAYVYGLTSWCWSFGLIGLFLRYLPGRHAMLAYLSESSYWVFLVHMLGTIGFGALLYNAPLGAPVKMAINIVATTAFTLITYHLFVRTTWVGALLNGRKADTPANLATHQTSP